MAITQRTKDVSNGPNAGTVSECDDLAAAIDWLENHTYLERRQYCYLGVDADGKHHHIDERENTIYVTDRANEDVTDSALPMWRIVGEVERVEDLDAHEDKTISDWVAFIASKRGWDDLVATIVNFDDVPVDDLSTEVR